MNRLFLQKLFFFALLFTPVIEIINSLTFTEFLALGTVGQIVKAGLLILALLILERKERAIFLLTTGTLLGFALLHQLFSFHEFSLEKLLTDIVFVMKIVYILPLGFLARRVSTGYILLASTLAWVIIVLNIAIGALGYGDTQYALGFGYKGFFYSGNEMVLTLMVVSATILYFLYKTRHTALGVCFSILLILIGVIQGMKTLLIGLPLLSIIIPILAFYKHPPVNSRGKTIKILLSASITFLFLFSLLAYLIPVLLPDFFARFLMIAEKSGIIGAILSERNVYLMAGLAMYFESFSWVEKLFGVGLTGALERIIPYLGAQKTMEIDFFDLLFSFGIAAIGYYFIWLRAIHTFYRNNLTFPTLISTLLFILSLLTGHVVYSTFLVTYWMLAVNLQQKLTHSHHVSDSVYFIGTRATGGIATYIRETVARTSFTRITPIYSNQDGTFIAKGLSFLLAIITLKFSLITDFLIGRKSILHLHTATAASYQRKLIITLLFSWFADKVVLHFHSGEMVVYFRKLVTNKINRRLLQYLLKRASLLIAVSQELHKELQEFFVSEKLPYGSFETLQNAIYLPKTFPTPLRRKQNEPIHILTISRLSSVKNIVLIPDIARALAKQGISFVWTIVGGGPDFDLLQEKVTSYSLQKNIYLVGEKEHKDVWKYYAKSHIFVLPSLFESFGLVVLEAYISGIPVITSDVGGLKNIVQDNKTGFLVPVNDTDAFVEKLTVLAKDESLRIALGTSAQLFVKDFSYDKHEVKLQRLLTQE